jgi:signal transduction histidine kinase
MTAPLRILLLEDNASEAEIIRRLLSRELTGCTLQLAGNRESYLAELDAFQPHIILSDNSLPQYSGLEALQAVRTRSQYIPFILITGTVSDEFAATIIKSGADDYILKDRLERLPSAIAAAIKHRQALESMQIMTEQIQEQKIQQQKQITRAIIRAQEKERNHLGRELHDNVNQILASTTVYLGLAARNNPAAKELITYAVGLINNAIEEIRLLSARQVTPLKDINLEELVRTLLQNLEGNSPLQTTFVYSATIDDDDLKLNIYRLIQEQVANIVKHAAAQHIDLLIEATKEQLLIMVTDDGKGFVPKQKRNGIGISNMINRVESFNGEIEINSQPGKGCTIVTKIPLG